MDESAHRDRLRRIERRQNLILVLLVVPYLLGIAKLIGVWTAGVLYAVFAVVAFAAVVFHRRRGPDAADR